MKSEGDTIQFESRAELGYLIRTLEEWKEEHKDADKTQQEVVKEFFNIIDYMEMYW